MRFAGIPSHIQWMLLIALGAAGGQGLSALGLPAGLMLGPLIVAAAMGMRGATVRVANLWFVLAQAVAGCLIGLHMDQDFVPRLAEIWWICALFIPLTFLSAAFAGIAAGRWARIDREAAVWGFLPGMAGTVIAIAHDRGLDSRMVAFLQILRLMIVIFVMAGVAMLLVGSAANVAVPTGPETFAGLAAAAGIVLIGAGAARWLPFIPAAASLVPLCLSVAASAAGMPLAVPGVVIAAAYLAIGLQVGLRFTPDLVRTGLRALPKVSLAVLLLLTLCAAAGGVLSLATGVDLLSAMLATVPGSVESIALIAIASQADVTFVMTLQTLRMFAVVLLGPFVTSLALRSRPALR